MSKLADFTRYQLHAAIPAVAAHAYAGGRCAGFTRAIAVSGGLCPLPRAVRGRALGGPAGCDSV